jgi:hypothetical protein
MMHVSSRRTCGLLTVFLFLGSLGAFAQHVAKGNAKNDDAAGQQVSADTRNQKVRTPDQQEVQVLLDGMKDYVNQSTEGLQVKRNATGAQYVDLDGRFENVAVAKIGPDGKVETGCVNNLADAKKFLQSKEPAKKQAPPKSIVRQSDPSTWEVK